jgi:hypothetical protein
MKKIGILTHHWVPNFGANLQAYSMLLNISKLHPNDDVELIDFRPLTHEKHILENSDQKQLDKHQLFFEGLKLSDKVSTNIELRKIIESYDKVYVGSDAVFRIENTMHPFDLKKTFAMGGDSIPDFFLYEMVNSGVEIHGISVSSMGTNYKWLTSSQKQKIAESLSHFSSISVRDQWTKLFVESLYGSLVKVTPDPVFGLDASSTKLFDSGFELRNQLPEDYIVVSLNPSYRDLYINIKEQARRSGIAVVSVRTPESICYSENGDLTIDHYIGPGDWYKVIGGSKGYIGHKFHGGVVALSQGRPACILDPHKKLVLQKHKSKMYALLAEFGLQELYGDHLTYTRLKSINVVSKLLDHKISNSILEKRHLLKQVFEQQLQQTL